MAIGSLAAVAGDTLVAAVTDACETAREKVARLFGRGEPDPAAELRGVPVALKKFPTDIPLTCDNEGFADSR